MCWKSYGGWNRVRHRCAVFPLPAAPGREKISDGSRLDRRRRAARLQRARDVGGNLRIDRSQPPHAIPFTHGERRTIAIDDAVTARGADSLAGSDNPGEIQRIRGAYGDQAAIGPDAPDLAQPFDSVRERELLPRHARHEPAAADLAPRLE